MALHLTWWSTIFYFKITKNIQICTRKFQKIKFYASFQFYFLCIFLVRGNLVSKYEQLLILTGIDASTLVNVPRVWAWNCRIKSPGLEDKGTDMKVNSRICSFEDHISL
jgi:hypothetical protein